eukprot:NODE_83_length_22457_cov_0.375794.p9 type:complete len:141 gc:universal NODE_83_length_22457_cov_0.375794:7202-6780(-)
MPMPNIRKQLRQFLGCFSFYRRLIPQMSSLTSPITDLLKQDCNYEFDSTHAKILKDANNLLVQHSLLVYPYYNREFHLQVDASDFGIGGHLFQFDDNKIPQPIYFFSRKLNSTQLKYTVVEKEALAVFATLEHLRMMLFG